MGQAPALDDVTADVRSNTDDQRVDFHALGLAGCIDRLTTPLRQGGTSVRWETPHRAMHTPGRRYWCRIQGEDAPCMFPSRPSCAETLNPGTWPGSWSPSWMGARSTSGSPQESLASLDFSSVVLSCRGPHRSRSSSAWPNWHIVGRKVFCRCLPVTLRWEWRLIHSWGWRFCRSPQGGVAGAGHRFPAGPVFADELGGPCPGYLHAVAP